MSKKSSSKPTKHEKEMSREEQLKRPNQDWKTLILEIFKKHEGRYGYRRIHTELKAQSYIINHKKYSELYKNWI